MNIKIIKAIQSYDLDQLVVETYKRPYCFQQQEGCQERGTRNVTVPTENPHDYQNDTISEVVNGSEMGISFKAWLTRDPSVPIESQCSADFALDLFWTRNFYPSLEMVMNDLHKRGLLEAGEYTIIIDW